MNATITNGKHSTIFGLYVTQVFLLHNENVHAVDKYGETPLHVACDHGPFEGNGHTRTAIVEYLTKQLEQEQQQKKQLEQQKRNDNKLKENLPN